MAKFAPGVITKYIGPSNTRGGRIKATYTMTGASTTIGYDHSQNDGGACKLAESMLGTSKLVYTELKDGGHIYIKA